VLSERMPKGRNLLTDPLTSRKMRGVRREGTAPELAVRKIVSGLGCRYRLGSKSLPGSPDLANRRQRWAIFVHGCFWHRHEGCPKATTPKTNRSFWREKFESNRRRDRRVVQQLKRGGFRTLTVWECQLVDERHVARVLREFLARSESTSDLG
jgi:DNA mismatch endonuclease, patch repair protein